MGEDRAQVRVLIVEDDETIARALAARLTHEGYAVSVARDAVTAASAARKTPPDVALLDITMPAGDGFDVARRIDRMAPGGAVPKIFITASKEPGLRKKAVEAGASAFVEKPFTADVLLAAIEEATAPAKPLPDVFE